MCIARHDVINAMYFQYIVLVVLLRRALVIGLEIIGEVSFDLHVPDQKIIRFRERPTEAPVLECVYQYPETSQADALLSNMMNQLTKVFTRAFTYVHGETRSMRRGQRRFKILPRGQREFFEQVYANMTTEYRRFYNETTQRMPRTGRDPCENQEEIKQQWVQLLDGARTQLSAATRRCVQHLLAVRNRASDVTTLLGVNDLVVAELATVRPHHLNLLCNDFQLCYNDLMDRL